MLKTDLSYCNGSERPTASDMPAPAALNHCGMFIIKEKERRCICAFLLFHMPVFTKPRHDMQFLSHSDTWQDLILISFIDQKSRLFMQNILSTVWFGFSRNTLPAPGSAPPGLPLQWPSLSQTGSPYGSRRTFPRS